MVLSSAQAYIEWRLGEKSNGDRGYACALARGLRLLPIAVDHPPARYHVESQNTESESYSQVQERVIGYSSITIAAKAMSKPSK
jgi:hypothetical protein